MRLAAALPSRVLDGSTRRVRVLLACLLLLFSAPVVADAASYIPPAAGATGDVNASNVSFVSTQGTSTGQRAGVYAINTSSGEASSGEVVWSYTKCPEKCFDVDPVSNGTVLFTARTAAGKPWEIGENTSDNWKAVHLNWRTGKVVRRFSVPIETHDVDYLGDHGLLVTLLVGSSSNSARL